MLDFALAAAHHVAAFVLLALLTSQMMLLQGPLEHAQVRRMAYLDAGYGLSALLVLGVGFARAIYAAKGWLYYSHNAIFWLKLAVFGLVSLISIYPTLMYRRWFKNIPNPVSPVEHRRVARCVYAEFILFLFIPPLAAAMARGIGSW